MALRGTGRLREQTRVRILQAAARLQYRPNSAARATRIGRLGSVDLLLGTRTASSLLPEQLLAEIHDALAQHSLRLAISRIPDDKLTDLSYVPRILMELSADGLLINYNAAVPPRMVELIEHHHLPSIWLNVCRAHDAVFPNDFQAARELTAAMMRLGHKRIAYVDYTHDPMGAPQHYSGVDRQRSYMQSMCEAGLEPLRLGSPQLRPRDGMVQTMRRSLAAAGRPTAVIAYGPEEARATIAAAMIERLDVPRDLSVACFGDRAIHDVGPRVTTMLLPHKAMAQQAVDMLMRKMTLPPEPIDAKAVAFEFLKAQTMAAAPALQ
jgi:DNA-binding LacI/PurR family transcriptional regulator